MSKEQVITFFETNQLQILMVVRHECRDGVRVTQKSSENRMKIEIMSLEEIIERLRLRVFLDYNIPLMMVGNPHMMMTRVDA